MGKYNSYASGYIGYFYNEASSTVINDFYKQKGKLWGDQKQLFRDRMRLSTEGQSPETSREIMTIIQKFVDGNVMEPFQDSLDAELKNLNFKDVDKLSSGYKSDDHFGGLSLEQVARSKTYLKVMKDADEYANKYSAFLTMVGDMIDQAAKLLQLTGVDSVRDVVLGNIVQQMKQEGDHQPTADVEFKFTQAIREKLYKHIMKAKVVDPKIAKAEKDIAEKFAIPTVLMRLIELEAILEKAPPKDRIRSNKKVTRRNSKGATVRNDNFLVSAAQLSAGWAKGLVGVVAEVLVAKGLDELSDEFIKELDLGVGSLLKFKSGGGSGQIAFTPDPQVKNMRQRANYTESAHNVTKEDVTITFTKKGAAIKVGGISVKHFAANPKGLSSKAFKTINIKGGTNLGSVLETTISLASNGHDFRAAFYNIAINRPRAKKYAVPGGDVKALEQSWNEAIEIIKIVSLIDALAGRGIEDNNVLSIVVKGKLISIPNILRDLGRGERSTDFKILWNPIARDTFAKSAFFLSAEDGSVKNQKPIGRIPAGESVSISKAKERSQQAQDLLLSKMYGRKMSISLGVANKIFH